MGFNSYEVRGSEVYTSVSDDFEMTGLPVFETRGHEVYPTTFNDRDAYGMPAFEIRDGYARPTSFNDHDAYGFDVPGDDEEDDDDEDLSLGGAAALLAIGAGIFAGAKVYSHVKERRETKADVQQPIAQQPTAQQPAAIQPAVLPPVVQPPATQPPVTAPPGWYDTEYGPIYWSGSAWTEPRYGPALDASPGATYAPWSEAPGTSNTLVVVGWIMAVITAGYMLPWAVAETRRTTNSTMVGLISFFLGWTIIGWIGALVMACTGRPASPDRVHF